MEPADRDMKLILKALPVEPKHRRPDLREPIVKSWFTEQLPALLHQNVLLEGFTTRRKQADKLAKAAKKLLDSLETSDAELGRSIIDAIMVEADVPPHQRMAVERRLETEREFLRDLAAAGENALARGRGRPRNNIARQAILDMAEMFRYFAGTEATRQVDRNTGEESGPFAHFCAAMWPVAFGSDDSLAAALRNYQDQKKARVWLDFNPTFLESLHRDHPEWGIFEDEQLD